MIYDPRCSAGVRENGATLTLQWRNGVTSMSEHLTYRLMVQYLLLLAALGDDVTVVRVE
jgi:hypothetical protein